MTIFVIDSDEEMTVIPKRLGQSKGGPFGPSDKSLSGGPSGFTLSKHDTKDSADREALPKHFEKLSLDLAGESNANTEKTRFTVVLFKGSEGDANGFSLFASKNGQQSELEIRLGELWVGCEVPSKLRMAFAFAVLCFVNRAIGKQHGLDIRIPEISFRHTRECAQELQLESLLAFYTESGDAFAHEVFSKLVGSSPAQTFFDASVDSALASSAFGKFDGYCQQMPGLLDRAGSRECLTKLAILLRAGDASGLLKVLSFYERGWLGQEMLLALVDHFDFEEFSWDRVGLERAKRLLVSTYRALTAEIEFGDFWRLVERIVPNLRDSPLGVDDFAFFFDSCRAGAADAVRSPKLTRFCFFEFSEDQLELVYEEVAGKQKEKLVQFAFEMARFEPGSRGQPAPGTGETRHSKAQIRSVFGRFFTGHPEFRDTVQNLHWSGFREFSENIFEKFLVDDLRMIQKLRSTGCGFGSEFKLFSTQLEQILGSKVLQKQLEFEANSQSEATHKLTGAVEELVRDESCLLCLLRELPESASRSTTFDLFLESTLDGLEHQFRQKNPKLEACFEVRKHLLRLLEKPLQGEQRALAKALVLHKFNEHFRFDGKLEFYELLFSVQRELRGQSRPGATENAEALAEIYSRTGLTESDYAVDDERFWGKLISLAKREPQVRYQFLVCLKALDDAFVYSENQFDKHRHLMQSLFRTQSEKKYFSLQADSFVKAVRHSLSKKRVFDSQYFAAKTFFKFLGVVSNPNLVKIYNFIRAQLFADGQSNSSPSQTAEKLRRSFSLTKVHRFLKEYMAQICAGENCYFEARVVQALYRRLDVSTVDSTTGLAKAVHEKLEKLFEMQTIVSKSDYLSHVTNFEEIDLEIALMLQHFEVIPSRRIEFSPFLSNFLNHQDLLENLNVKINFNGLLYILAKKARWNLLRSVLDSERLLLLRNCFLDTDLSQTGDIANEVQASPHDSSSTFNSTMSLNCLPCYSGGKRIRVYGVPVDGRQIRGRTNLIESIEYEANPAKISILQLIQYAKSHILFMSKLDKLRNLVLGDLRRDAQVQKEFVSLKRVKFLMFDLEPGELSSEFLRKVHQQVSFLKNHQDFFRSLEVVSGFLGLEFEFGAGEFRNELARLSRKDDFERVARLLQTVPQAFLRVSSGSSCVLRFLTLLGSEDRCR